MSSDSDPAGPDRPDSSGDEPLVQPIGDQPPDTGPLPGDEGSDSGLAPGDEEGSEAAANSSPADPTPVPSLPEYESPASIRSRQRRDSHNMLPGRDRRRTGVERMFVRLIATGGIVGIGVAIAAIMVSSKSQGWVVGLVVSIVSVVLAAILWSSRQL